jgi:hypothetical protein
MIGEHIAFDNLKRVGREVAIPSRYHDWAKSSSNRAEGEVLIEVFREIVAGGPEPKATRLGLTKEKDERVPLSESEALVGVWELAPNAPTPPPTNVHGQLVPADNRIVSFIQHPVHWAMIAARASDQHYRLTCLFAVDLTTIKLEAFETHIRKHMEPARAYREVKSDGEKMKGDVGLIQNQCTTAQATPDASKAKPAGSKKEAIKK